MLQIVSFVVAAFGLIAVLAGLMQKGKPDGAAQKLAAKANREVTDADRKKATTNAVATIVLGVFMIGLAVFMNLMIYKVIVMF